MKIVESIFRIGVSVVGFWVFFVLFLICFAALLQFDFWWEHFGTLKQLLWVVLLILVVVRLIKKVRAGGKVTTLLD